MSKKSKNIIIAILGIGIVGALGYVALNKSNKTTTTLSEHALVDFSVEDTSVVDMIEIKPMQGNGFKLVKQNGVWTGENGYCIQQDPVHNILDAFKNIKVQGFPSDAAQDNIKNLMTVESNRVFIYQNGKLIKTWIVGNSTPDHYGCYMLLEKDGKQSPKVVITEMPGFNGTLATRFFANPLEWSCTNLFNYNPKDIKKVEVINNEQKELSFEVEQFENGTFSATKNGGQFKFDTNEVRNYLINYKKIHFENLTVDLSKREMDSLSKSTPYIKLRITDMNGDVVEYATFRKNPYAGKTINLEGEEITYDQDRLWLQLEDGSFARCQYFVFDRLFLGYRPIFGDYSI
jgi:hypothetical protein